MKNEIQLIKDDIDRFEKELEYTSENDDSLYQKAFYDFRRKYSYLVGFPVFAFNNPAPSLCREYVIQIYSFLKSYISRFDVTEDNKNSSITDLTKVFIVHGHNGELKEAVARIIEKQSLEAIILSEQTNRGKTIIEKFEATINVGAAICLFTADDKGRSASDTSDKDRARQNVVFETGYFIGKLGRENIIIIADSSVEIPSDLYGVVYTSRSDWKTEILKELKAIGYDIDLNKL